MNKVCYYYMGFNSEIDNQLNKKIDRLRGSVAELYRVDIEEFMRSEENMQKLADVETNRLRGLVDLYMGIIIKYFQ